MRIAILCACLLIASALTAMPQDRGKDGHYHDPNTGEAQPDFCDNALHNEHPCTCNHANEKCDGPSDPGSMCKTYCRKEACKCVNSCTS